MNCQYCNKKLQGRSDKKFCNPSCKSAYQYQQSKADHSYYYAIDRQLKTNRKILKRYKQLGKTTIRLEKLLSEGFDPNFYTHQWTNPKGITYHFVYEFGFTKTKDANHLKYRFIDWQPFMK